MNKCKVCNVDINDKRKYYSNKCKFSDVDYNKKRSLKSHINNEQYYCECIKTGKKFRDYNNLSGILSKHVIDIYNVKYTSNKFSDYFIKKQHENLQYLTCPYCNWKTKDINNKSGCFTSHILKIHNKTLTELYMEYPNYFNNIGKMFLNNKEYINHISNDNNYITCKICNEKLKVLTNSHLKLHNITQKEYKNKYGNIISNCSNELFKNNINIANSNIKYISNGQLEIEMFLKENNIEYVRNVRNIIHPFELDIYIPSKKIAIEYNGLYCHSEDVVGKHYHVNKTELCSKNNIQLIHIFEDEWKEKTNIIKSILKSKLNLIKDKIYSRKCVVSLLNNKDKNLFLN